MNKRAAIQEAIVGGSTGLFVVAAFIVVRSWSGASDTELLSFAGAVIGATVTVAGSIFIFQWQRDTERREERQLLLELLDDVDSACVPFQVANETALRERYEITCREQVAGVQAAIERVHEFRRDMKPKTARMMRASSALADLAFDEPGLEQHLTSLMMYPDSADFGHLNYLGHEIKIRTAISRRLLDG